MSREGGVVIAGEGLHPVLVSVAALAEHLLVEHRNSENLAEEIHHLLGTGQPAQVAMDDDAVEAVVYKNKQAAKQLCEELHRSPPLILS